MITPHRKRHKDVCGACTRPRKVNEREREGERKWIERKKGK